VPLNVEDKKAIVADVGAQLAAAQTVVLAEYRGIPVGELTTLRANARSQGVYLRVLKNTLARRAAQGTQFEQLGDSMVGPLIYGISADPVAPAKVLHQFSKGQDQLVIKAGFYNGKVLDVNGVKELATIPSREELLSMLLGVMKAPVSAMARVLGAVAEQKASGAPAVAAAPASPEPVAEPTPEASAAPEQDNPTPAA
jgi:large subunit ribosomal protein L10